MYSAPKFYQGDTFLEGQLYLSPSIFNVLTAFTNAVLWSSESLINRSNPLQIYFGSGARQDNDYLSIEKSDLTSLTPSSTNTAESLLIALLLKSLDVTNDDDDNILITLFDTYIIGNKIRNTLLIQCYYPATPAQQELEEPLEINPMNYGL
jgi:hypothetical protein